MNILIHPTMTVMTDDSFLNLRGKEVLVYIYYNIYNTNSIPSPIFNNCHLSFVIQFLGLVLTFGSVPSGFAARPPPSPPPPEIPNHNLKSSKITFSGPRCYDSLHLGDFVLKIAPNRGPKFGSAQYMLYLCNAFGYALRVKAAAQHSSSELGSAFALHFTWHCQSMEQREPFNSFEWQSRDRERRSQS